MLFVIGVPRNLTFQKAIKAEAKQYGDILQFNFIEGKIFGYLAIYKN